MKLNVGGSWILGVLLLLMMVVIAELTVAFDDYIFHRLGINRNLLSILLWTLPFFAAFITSYYSKKYKVLLGLSFALLTPAFAALGRYLNGEMGGAVDFTGSTGAILYFKINFVIAALVAIIGTALGYLLSERRD